MRIRKRNIKLIAFMLSAGLFVSLLLPVTTSTIVNANEAKTKIDQYFSTLPPIKKIKAGTFKKKKIKANTFHDFKKNQNETLRVWQTTLGWQIHMVFKTKDSSKIRNIKFLSPKNQKYELTAMYDFNTPIVQNETMLLRDLLEVNIIAKNGFEWWNIGNEHIKNIPSDYKKWPLLTTNPNEKDKILTYPSHPNHQATVDAVQDWSKSPNTTFSLYKNKKNPQVEIERNSNLWFHMLYLQHYTNTIENKITEETVNTFIPGFIAGTDFRANNAWWNFNSAPDVILEKYMFNGVRADFARKDIIRKQIIAGVYCTATQDQCEQQFPEEGYDAWKYKPYPNLFDKLLTSVQTKELCPNLYVPTLKKTQNKCKRLIKKAVAKSPARQYITLINEIEFAIGTTAKNLVGYPPILRSLIGHQLGIVDLSTIEGMHIINCENIPFYKRGRLNTPCL